MCGGQALKRDRLQVGQLLQLFSPICAIEEDDVAAIINPMYALSSILPIPDAGITNVMEAKIRETDEVEIKRRKNGIADFLRNVRADGCAMHS